MEYIALKESYGFGGRYLKKGDKVIITDEEKAGIDEAYFNTLFKAVHVEESVEETDDTDTTEKQTEESVEEKPKRKTTTRSKSKE